MLCPALHPGDVVVMDNLSAHKVSGVRELIQAAGAELLYLPPYSPDLNPIELAWAKLKPECRNLIRNLPGSRFKYRRWTRAPGQVILPNARSPYRHHKASQSFQLDLAGAG